MKKQAYADWETCLNEHNEYEPNRDKYKNFEEFYPEVIKLL